MKNFVNALFDLALTMKNMYLDTVCDIPTACGMDAWQEIEMNGKKYRMHMEVSWEEI